MATTIDQFTPSEDGQSFSDTTADGTIVQGVFNAATNTQSTVISRDPGAGQLQDVGVQVDPGINSRTIFDGRSVNSIFNGNDASNFVRYTDRARDAEINTGAGDDRVRFDSSVGGSIDLGDGDDTAKTNERVKDTTIDTGTGDDSLVFGGTVKGAEISVGDGADELVFRSKIQDTTVDLGGPDGQVDRIVIRNVDDIKNGFVITGADEGDLLIIGGEEYSYDAGTDTWQSGNDTLKFN